MTEIQKLPRAWLSLGENCLSDNILKRHSLKSFSTPYSSSRSNVDYAVQLERTNYRDFLDPTTLVYGEAWGQKVVRSQLVMSSDDIFDPSCRHGFEFTHHDVISDLTATTSYGRKISRLKSLKGKRDVTFLYHHRICKNTDPRRLKEKLRQFIRNYQSEDSEANVVFFYQKIISAGETRALQLMHNDRDILEFKFFTENRWGGSDPELLWARTDDDLIKVMLETSQRIINQKTSLGVKLPTSD